MILCKKLFRLDDEGLTVADPLALCAAVDAATESSATAGTAAALESSEDEEEPLLDL